jgi:hypothetical protein
MKEDHLYVPFVILARANLTRDQFYTTVFASTIAIAIMILAIVALAIAFAFLF